VGARSSASATCPGTRGASSSRSSRSSTATRSAATRSADELWPDGLPQSWESALRAVVSKVRAAGVRAGLGQELVGSAFGCYQLPLGDGTVDVEVAADALHQAEIELARGEAGRAASHALVTCIICRRPFLLGLYNPWTVALRSRLVDLHVSARQVLAEAHAALGATRSPPRRPGRRSTSTPTARRSISA